MPGIKLPPDYGTISGRSTARPRSLLVEGAGGPTWYTEYNVLTGLSARSYGRLSYYVTRIAAGRVERGLPQALRRCGYKTITLYPAYGAFLSARKFQRDRRHRPFPRSADMKAGDIEPDRFYYDQALKMIAKREGRPAAVHVRLYGRSTISRGGTSLPARPDAGLARLGNEPEVDEYLRRQTLSARDYAGLQGAARARLSRRSRS